MLSYLHRRYDSAGSKVINVTFSFPARCTRSHEESTVLLELSSTMYVCAHLFLEALNPGVFAARGYIKVEGSYAYTRALFLAIIYNKDTGLVAKGKKRMFCHCIAKN